MGYYTGDILLTGLGPRRMRTPIAIFVPVLIVSAIAHAAGADTAALPAAPAPEGIVFFETNIRPLLVECCYECHSTQAKKLKGKLALDSQPGIAKGGESGPVLIPGDVEKSPLIKAIRWTDPDFSMPPEKKLSPRQIEKFEQWVKMGAPDPRAESTAKAPAPKVIDFDAGRKWWSFQPVQAGIPHNRDTAWTRKKIDSFILQELEARQLAPSPQADPRTLIQRVYLDLTGIRPAYEQVETFAKNPSDEAYAKIVEELLASPQYGQRWGRYWLDVARYGEDNPTNEASNPGYPFAWRYRDWVIQALNKDVPYDRFVTLQLAADLVPGAPRSDLAATGFLGAAPVYHKDGRLSKDVVENVYMDEWDERVDTVSRGVLGLTVACARCHDHKFDPISTRDYYALAGVFASTAPAPRPIADVDKETETKFMAASQRIFYLSYRANLLRDDPGSKRKDARQKVEASVEELAKIEDEIAPLRAKYPDMLGYLQRLDRRPNPYSDAQPVPPVAKASDPGGETPPQAAKPPAPAAGNNGGRRRGGGNNVDPFYNAIYDAGLWVNGSDPDFTMLDIKPGEARDLRVLPGGNVAKPGDVVPRGFPSVLAKGDAVFHTKASGRLELSEKIFTDAAPLAARVIVNRVWAWHFGKPLVDTLSDFGVQGEKPTHPQLLDDLSNRFIASGWSLKWLHREIVLSAAWRQASTPRADAGKVDPANRLLWRMNPRRLDIEAYRDCILQAAGTLDTTLGGPSIDLGRGTSTRRTVYARITRGRVSNMLALYGFPEPTMHSPGRETVTSPLQQLFVMNSPFIQDQATALAGRVSKEADVDAKVREMYRQALQRDPTDHELSLAREYLATGTLTDYAQALLATNEVIFWP